MKKHFIVLFLFLAIAMGRSQSQDLANLANGEILSFKTLYEKNDKLFGYFALYTTGKSEEGKKNFEYVILDKNLNKVANKEFEAESYIETFNAYMDIHGKIKMLPSIDTEDKSYKSKNFVPPYSKLIDIKKNTIEKEEKFCYENGVFVDCSENKSNGEYKKESQIERKENGFVYSSNVYEIKQGGFLIFDNQDYKSYIKNNSIILFDENKKELWKYSYNQNGTKNKFDYMRLIDIDDKNIYGILGKVESDTKYSFSLLVFDLKTGEIVANKPLNDLNQYTLRRITSFYEYSSFGHSFNNSKAFDNDKIILVGKNYPTIYESDGYARLMIDKKTFEIRSDILTYETDIKDYVQKSISNDYLKKYSLQVKDLFFLADGSVGMLAEKFKINDSFGRLDMVYLYTGKDFKLQGFKILKEEKQKKIVNDYLFSQYLNNDKDLVFFYEHERKNKETKTKETFLYINTLIAGKFNQEQIPIINFEKDNIITPYVAKEGYILLREYNNNKNEKYNQIRLEKLNY